VTTARFAGARFNREIVLLDRTTNSLVHLNETAVRVWENCERPDSGTDAPPASVRAETPDVAPVQTALVEAGLLHSLNGRFVRVSVEWV
jgi:hypothetical protein